MREMILNHASVGAFDSDLGEASKCLRDVVGGMGQLVNCGAVSKILRVANSYYYVRCQLDYSLHDVLQELRRQHLEEYLFFVGLMTKSPLLDEISPSVRDRFQLCEEQTLSEKDAQPLVLAAIQDWVLIGLPSQSRWDCDRLTVEFDELLADETFDRNSEDIDQLTRLIHADPICIRHRSRVAKGIGNDAGKLWENRQNIFPHIQFGPAVERHLASEANHLPVIIKKLESLDQSGKEWAEVGGAMPPWKTKVTQESDRVMNSQTLRNHRYFRSQSGALELFEWHARFGGSGRIHLRFDAKGRTIEIGYIGSHLPL